MFATVKFSTVARCNGNGATATATATATAVGPTHCNGNGNGNGNDNGKTYFIELNLIYIILFVYTEVKVWKILHWRLAGVVFWPRL